MGSRQRMAMALKAYASCFMGTAAYRLRCGHPWWLLPVWTESRKGDQNSCEVRNFKVTK
jgi:hypothetical protein